MPQAFLGANPGTSVEDVLAPELLDATDDLAAADVTGAAVEVNFPGRVGVKLVAGTITGTGDISIEIQGADDSGFSSNVVSLGRFDDLVEASDGEERFLAIHAWKPFVRAVSTKTGTVTAADAVVTVVPQDYHAGNLRTA